MPSSSSFAALLLILAVVLVFTSSTEGRVEKCVFMLGKYCQTVAPAACRSVDIVQSIQPISDCCTSPCSEEGILAACCANL
ncbi:unnamed protein product [Caenorhabditis sp. 36 PRJEB53466]|nr:unnamed protein product [Caenorhabditis sp. 36 PRJEB53466]